MFIGHSNFAKEGKLRLGFLFKDKTKSGTVLLVILLTLGLGCWFGYTAWKEAVRESSEWRVANDEMRELLARQSAPKSNPDRSATSIPKGKDTGDAATDTKEQAKSSETPAPETTSQQAPATMKPTEKQGEPAASPSAGKKTNLNTASLQQLDALPGIGESKAKAIVAHREKLGGKFQSIDQLLDVKGIGEKMLDKMRPYLTVDP